MVLGVKVCGATLGWSSDPLSLALGWKLFPGRPHHILQNPTNTTFPLTSITLARRTQRVLLPLQEMESSNPVGSLPSL